MVSSSARFRDREGWLFAGLVVLHLLPIWLLPLAPTQDGPAHLSMAHGLRQLGSPAGDYLRYWLAPNREAIPNWFVFYLLADILRPFSLPVAEKIVLSLYAVLLPLSARYALEGVRRRAGFLAVLVLPFTYNLLLNMGFYNFCFSLAAFLLSVGFWLRYGGRMGPVRTIGLALLVLWTFFCHPVTLGVLVGTLLALASWRTFLELRRGRLREWRTWRWLAGVLVACAPAVLLLLSFLQHRMAGPVSDMTLAAKARQLASLYSLVSLDRRLLALALALVVLLGLLTVPALLRRLRRRRLFTSDGILLAALLVTGVYFVAPDQMGQGGFVTQRLNLFPWLLLILWLGTVPYPQALRAAIRSAGAAVALGFLAAMFALWAGFNAYLGEILTVAPHLAPHRTLLSLSFSNAGEDEDGTALAFRTWPFVHAGSHLAARLPLVDLSLYEEHENYFPLVYRPGRDPYLLLAADPLDLEAEPPRVDLRLFHERTGGSIDYVLLLWPKAVRQDDPSTQFLRSQLAEEYDRIATTSPRGIAELYRLKTLR